MKFIERNENGAHGFFSGCCKFLFIKKTSEKSRNIIYLNIKKGGMIININATAVTSNVRSDPQLNTGFLSVGPIMLSSYCITRGDRNEIKTANCKQI